jgi:hypothetical protein
VAIHLFNNGEPKMTPRLSLFLAITALLAITLTTLPQTALAQDKLTPANLTAQLHGLKKLSFHPGDNDVHFDGIDADGRITVGYMQFGTTGSHDVFIVTMQADSGSWLIVPIGNNEDETIDDAPFDGELVEKTVRFFNGFLGSTPETFLFIAGKDYKHRTATGGTPVNISVEILKPDDEPPFSFQPILEYRTAKTYDDANEALFSELKIPKP